MAIIALPSELNQGVEVLIDAPNRKFRLNIDETNPENNLSNDGVTLQALYSFFKEEWKRDNNLIPFPFPMVAITPEQFEFVSDWEPENDETRKLIRTGGWAEVDSSGNRKREYLGVITLGNIDAEDTAYYAFESDTEKTDFTFSGPVNEPIQIYGDAANGDFNKKQELLTLFIRVQGKTYGRATTTDIGVGAMTYKVERFPLSEAPDLNITADDATIETTAPYTNMSVEFFDVPQDLTFEEGGETYPFGIIVNANDGNAKQVYEFVQYQLRKNANINERVGGLDVNGLLADPMVVFIGDRLDTLSATNPEGGGSGVYIMDISSSSINDVRYVDNNETYRTFPFLAGGVINFSSTLAADDAAVYRMFFTETPLGSFGTADAITVLDASGEEIAGQVNNKDSISFTFDYDGNDQGDRTPANPANVTVVAIGLDNAQYVLAEGTINRSSENVITLVSALERNYSNE